jgi:hypothetical protein
MYMYILFLMRHTFYLEQLIIFIQQSTIISYTIWFVCGIYLWTNFTSHANLYLYYVPNFYWLLMCSSDITTSCSNICELELSCKVKSNSIAHMNFLPQQKTNHQSINIQKRSVNLSSCVLIFWFFCTCGYWTVHHSHTKELYVCFDSFL